MPPCRTPFWYSGSIVSRSTSPTGSGSSGSGVGPGGRLPPQATRAVTDSAVRSDGRTSIARLILRPTMWKRIRRIFGGGSPEDEFAALALAIVREAPEVTAAERVSDDFAILYKLGERTGRIV